MSDNNTYQTFDGFTQKCDGEDFGKDADAAAKLYEQLIYTGQVSNDPNRPQKASIGKLRRQGLGNPQRVGGNR